MNQTSEPRMQDVRVTRAVEEYLAAWEAGRRPSRQDFLARHADIADALAECLDGLDFIRSAAPGLKESASPSPLSDAIHPEGLLGDFRILRELGRGGMGVVYEAVQISLGRRVALKVLPFAATLDPKQLQRFKNEAHAAAQLHHTNIVPIYFVGVERGVHFYAMQFIDGQTLAQLIAELRQTSEPRPTESAAEREQLTTDYTPLPVSRGSETPLPVGRGSENTPAVAARSTDNSTNDPAFFRTVANLGVQAAEALEHAHSQGVVHRDIKPANLLLEGQPGVPGEPGASATGVRLWITDFGLARLQGDAGQTLTGDLVGTLRYMSPEQALAKRELVDHRTDIYSLGATLYELLTLAPVFSGRDRQELLRQIADEDPRLPRRTNKAIPAELETIVLKAMEKNPADRYATAQQLADDLERFLKDEPIRAKRPSLVQRARKWARRHRPVVASAIVATGAVVAIAIVALLISLGNIWAALGEKSAALDREKQTREDLELTAYIQRIALAERELAAGNVGRAEELLDECPEHLRGWEWHFLKRQRYDKPPPLQHNDTVIRVAFSPDGRQIASKCMDGTLQLWDARTGQVLHTLQRQTPFGPDMAYSPDSRYLAAARQDGVVGLWDATSGQLLHTLEAHKGPAWQVAFSPDSQTLASGGSDRTVRLWDVTSGKMMQEFTDHPAAVKGVVFRPDGPSVLAACDDGTVKGWDRHTGQETFSFRDEILTGPERAFFSPDGRRLAWAWLDGVIKIWDTTTGRLEIDQQTNLYHCHAVSFSPDGHRIALAGRDGTLRLLDAASGREMLTIFAHPSPVAHAAFSPDGNKLASGSYDLTVRIWDATELTGDPQAAYCVTLTGHKSLVSGVAFSPDSRWLASSSWDGTVKLWELLGKSELGVPGPIALRSTLRGHRENVAGVAFSSDNRTLASASWDQTVKLWDLSEPVLKTGLRTDDGDALAERGSIPLPQRAISVAFSPDGRLLAIGQPNGIAIYDPATGKEAHPFKRTPTAVPSVAFSPDNRWLISAGASDPAIKVWDVAGDKFSFEIRQPANPNASAAVSPDGRRIAAPFRDQAAGEHTAKVWDVNWDAKTYAEFRTLKGHVGKVFKIAFSPDGRYLATGSWDSTIKVWDLEAPESAEPVTLRGHAGFVYGLAFSPDGRRLASASGYARRGEVKVWDATLWENKVSGGR